MCYFQITTVHFLNFVMNGCKAASPKLLYKPRLQLAQSMYTCTEHQWCVCCKRGAGRKPTIWATCIAANFSRAWVESKKTVHKQKTIVAGPNCTG